MFEYFFAFFLTQLFVQAGTMYSTFPLGRSTANETFRGCVGTSFLDLAATDATARRDRQIPRHFFMGWSPQLCKIYGYVACYCKIGDVRSGPRIGTEEIACKVSVEKG